MSRLFFAILICVLSLGQVCFSQPEEQMSKQNPQDPIVIIKTSLGNIEVELYPEKAPTTVKNFLQYVSSGHYSHTIFHRVIDGFMIQGGGFTKGFEQKPTEKPIQNEADNGLKNVRGTIAMARTSDVNSATAQFFINTVDNSFLDFKGKNPRDYGYTVFGKVISGMDVVDKIAKTKTGTQGAYQNVPVDAVEILEVTQKK